FSWNHALFACRGSGRKSGSHFSWNRFCHKPRRGPGHALRRGKGSTGVEALPGEVAQQNAQKGILAAEQMGAAADVEHQAVAAVERDKRREVIAPVGETAEQAVVGF